MTPYPWPDPVSKAAAAQRTWAMLPHLAIFTNFAFPFAGVIASIVIYWQRSKDGPSARDNQRRALNFGVTIGSLYGCSAFYQFASNFASNFAASFSGKIISPAQQMANVLPAYFINFGMMIVLLLCCVAACFAAHAAWFGQPYRYPFAIPFVRAKTASATS